MRVRKDALVSPLRVGGEKVDADNVSPWVVAPEQVTRARISGVLFAAFTGVNRS